MAEIDRTAKLRELPQIDALVREVAELGALEPGVARWLARREVEAARERALAGGDIGDVRAAVARAARALHARRLRRVINATGVVLHTNLGRAALSTAAAARVLDAAGATALELDLETGERGARAPVAATLAAALCDAQDALIVNNNAGALLLGLAALARGREVIVSRGELIEIGGEFRLPDVMEASGAILREVGTTNRTHARDYRRSLGERTALILKVHPSNYEVVGFTAQPPLADIVEIARGGSVPLFYDVGSGLLRPEGGSLGGALDLAEEPDAQTALATGCDLVCFSGDKLLGGPQAGILAGRADLIERCRRNPIARAVRADKLTLAALEETLWAHATGARASIPTWSMLAEPASRIGERARAIAARVPEASVIDGASVTGGGSLPGRSMPTALLAIGAERPNALAAALRANEPPVIARVDRDRVIVDLRTVSPGEDDAVAEALARALGAEE